MNSKVFLFPYVNSGKPFTMYYEHERFINEVLVNKEYESLLKGLQLFNRNDLVVVDLGCNIGTFSLYIYDKVKEIHAVDFVPPCIEIFQKTIDHNNFTKIKVYQKAIAGENKTVNVSSLTGTDGGNSIYGQAEEIPTQTLSSFCKEVGLNHIDLLKLDVEGAEKDILLSPDFSEIQKNIGMIVGEYHAPSIEEILTSLGYNYILQDRHFIAF
jgi:FkbM family methyltransferase